MTQNVVSTTTTAPLNPVMLPPEFLDVVARFVDNKEETFHEVASSIFHELIDRVATASDVIEYFEYNFVGIYPSWLDYACEFADEELLSEAPSDLKYYFDYSWFARDLSFDYFIVELPRYSGVAIFHNV